jgi:phosphate transport system substrate-binding protein
MIRYTTLFILIVAISFFVSCENSQQSHSDPGFNRNIIRIDGSSTVYTITEAIAEEYLIVHPGTRLTIGVSGTGGGFKKFARGETVISNASRPISQSEMDDCYKNDITFIELPVAYDGLAVIVNPRNTWVNELTVAELKKIWEPAAQNNIMKWSQVRSGFPDMTLKLFGPGTASGTFDYFTETVVGKSGSSRGDYMPSEDDHVLIQGVAGDLNALGFVGLAYYEENTDKLKLLGVNAGGGPVKPDFKSIREGNYIPLTRSIFIYVSDKATHHPEIVNFVKYYLKNAARLAGDVGYVPLPEKDYELHLSQFETFIRHHQNISE